MNSELYDSMCPQAAKWLLPDGTVTDKMPTSSDGGTTNHAELENLDFENSGHTGFASQADMKSAENRLTALENARFIPDRANRTAVLNSDGTWEAEADGFVQRSATITHPSTAFATFRLFQNGVIAWANEHAGLQSSGLYEFTSDTVAALAGDIITTESEGSGITSTLYFMPPRG